MFQATRRRLALWYTGVTAVLLLLFATGFYLYVRHTLVERIDDTLNHVVEIVQRSLVIQPLEPGMLPAASAPAIGPDSAVLPAWRVDLEASFPGYAAAVEDDHIDLEWFSPAGELLWSTFSVPTQIPLHPNSDGETVYGLVARSSDEPSPANLAAEQTDAEPPAPPFAQSLAEADYPSAFALRQVTQPVAVAGQVVGYLRVSHPWFEVTKPSRQLIRDLSLGVLLVIGAVAAIGWLLSGLAIAPVRDSYQHLKQFTADASHELRNPIAVIQTNVQVALADPDPSLQQDQLKVIERLTRRLGRLVDDLLFLSRQDSGIIELKTGPVQLDCLLQDVVEEQQALADEKGVALKLLLDGETEEATAWRVVADADQLVRLFTNLIGNAVQYTPQGGVVKISLHRHKLQGGGLQVQVQDSGIGITSEALSHIFERFYRVDPARPSLKGNRSTGSGLGLAIAQAIVENHHGQIQAKSSPGQGTTFTVLLPG
jgi:two-component system, OmpR family, manganese sensing sensor histidine kinase